MSQFLQNAYFSDKMTEKSAHYHTGHQLIYITKGTVEVCVKNAKIPASAGSLLVFSRFENHAIRIRSAEYERYVLSINAPVSGAENHIFSLLFHRPKDFYNVIDLSGDRAACARIFERIVEEFRGRESFSGEMQQLLVRELLLLINRRLPALFFLDEPIRAVQRELEENCRAPFTLEGLAREHNMSVSSLSHRFKQYSGVSVMAYLLSCRMALAKNYLAATNLEIGEIVEKCGFSDSSNFSRAFRRQTGLTPTAFRARAAG